MASIRLGLRNGVVPKELYKTIHDHGGNVVNIVHRPDGSCVTVAGEMKRLRALTDKVLASPPLVKYVIPT